MKPFKPRPKNKWPEELKKVIKLKPKDWQKAVIRIVADDLKNGEENIKKINTNLG